MNQKSILAEIERLKQEKPPHYKSQMRKLCMELHRLNGVTGHVVKLNNADRLGRKAWDNISHTSRIFS